MQVKEIGINTGKMKGYGICKKKYQISFLGGPTTPTYSTIGKRVYKIYLPLPMGEILAHMEIFYYLNRNF